ncbi:unnamed protein product [Brachionus calyciflorus]|uniref:Uncharacterized protein n=1 Tax=Brachionus calyciflorus TaxID=104777 RepID=A0A814MG90_9BILA|nr:unnamed protein product [Brachionus calyciflorus]
MSEGVLKTYYIDTLEKENTEIPNEVKVKKLNVSRKIKSEFENKNQIDPSVFQDAFISKKIFQKYDSSSNKNAEATEIKKEEKEEDEEESENDKANELDEETY